MNFFISFFCLSSSFCRALFVVWKKDTIFALNYALHNIKYYLNDR